MRTRGWGAGAIVVGFTLGALVVAMSPRPAAASTIFTLGNNPQPNEENVLFSSTQPGTTITGLTNQSNVAVSFSSITDTLQASALGQADVQAADDHVNNVTVQLAPGFTFQDIILNPENGSGTATVTVVADDGGFVFAYQLGVGNNFVTINAAAGESIVGATLDAPGGFDDLKQPRISGVASAVPEPVTLLLLGTSFVGIAMLARRQLKK